MTFQVSYSELFCYFVPWTDNNRYSLTELPEDGWAHIHGRLDVKIAGRLLPYLGWWGPEDVCMGDWTKELYWAACKLESTDPSEYVYDEGEQAKPAFKFARKGSSVFVSIVASSERDGDPEWQDVECSLTDFISAINNFIDSFKKTVVSLSPIGGRKWVENYMGSIVK